MALRRLLARRRRGGADARAEPAAAPIYIYPGLLRTAPARAILLDALCPAAPYGDGPCGRPAVAAGAGADSGCASGSTAPACCPICFDDFAETSLVRTLYCSHQYHSQCLLAWLLKGYAARCPMCAASLSLPVECVAGGHNSNSNGGGGGGVGSSTTSSIVSTSTAKDPGAACARALVRAPVLHGATASSAGARADHQQQSGPQTLVRDSTGTADSGRACSDPANLAEPADTADARSHTPDRSAPSFRSQSIHDLALSMGTPIVQLPQEGVGLQTLCAVPPGEVDSDLTMRSYCYMEHDFARFSKHPPGSNGAKPIG